jgi:hypothetical protein
MSTPAAYTTMEKSPVFQAQFQVVKTFSILKRRLFVVSGRIHSGMVKPGMQLQVNNTGRSFQVDINSVDFVDPPESGDHEIGLCIYMGGRDWALMLEESFPSGSVVPVYPSPKRFPCPCCGYLTLKEAPTGTFSICEVCFWEDDPIQFHDVEYKGGANGPSLREASANFTAFGASEERFVKSVRAPRSYELAPGS